MNNLQSRLFPVARVASIGITTWPSKFHTTGVAYKVHKSEKKSPKQIIHTESAAGENNVYIKKALEENTNLETILTEELNKHFSLQVNLSQYEDIIVKLEKGDEHKMSLLGRVTLKNPQMVMINFADNPSAIKWAKLALQKSALGVNPQHEGVVLYIPTPRMTRERREQLAKDAAGKILNDYKKALNDVYTRYDKKCSQESMQPDVVRKTRQELLSMKKAMDARATEQIKRKKNDLLKEDIIQCDTEMNEFYQLFSKIKMKEPPEI